MTINLADPHYSSYQAMLHDLQAGLRDSANIRAGLSTWCGGCSYSSNAGSFEATGEAHLADVFNESGGSTPTTTADCSVCNSPIPCAVFSSQGTQPNVLNYTACQACSGLAAPNNTKDIVQACSSCICCCILGGGAAPVCQAQCLAEFSGQAGVTPGFPNPLSGVTLPTWLQGIPWPRVLLGAAGIGLIIVSAVIFLNVLTGGKVGDAALEASKAALVA